MPVASAVRPASEKLRATRRVAFFPTAWRPADEEPPPPSRKPTADQQIDALLTDTEFPRFVRFTETEVMRVWNLPRTTAAGFVLSAVGEPKTLAAVHHQWFSAKTNGTSLGLAKLIVRRRVLDLLRSDARRLRHEPLPATDDEVDDMLGSPDDRHDPHAQAELNQIVTMVRAALACFARQGSIPARQAELVQRYALDEATCPELAAELGCSQNALGVRIHKAMRALRRHIEACHPELEELLERTSARSQRA